MSSEKKQQAKDALKNAGVPGAELLVAYMVSLMEMNEKINLTGAKDMDTFAIKHIADCFRAWEALGGLKRPVVDVGSGGGLPGIVLSILSPGTPVTLVERRKKKAQATRDILKEIGLDKKVNVVDEPFEALKSEITPDYEIWFRGVMPGEEFGTYISQHFREDEIGPIVLMKGPSWSEEYQKMISVKSLNKFWKERFIQASSIDYELPHSAGSRKLILI